MSIQRVLTAIEEIKKGNMVIMLDDEDRENEGDLVYASALSTPDKVNFMASYAKGLICTTIDNKIASRLKLTPMVNSNNSNHETAFTISVDAASATTGISTKERDDTIKIIANPISKSKELVAPGHIFPLIAKDGGVLERTGHTEGSFDLCTLAGISGGAVICEIMKDDGTMARRDDLDIFAKKHNMHMVFISDLVEYRLANESLINLESNEKIEFFGVELEKFIFKDHLNLKHTVIKFGDIKSTTNIKFHSPMKDLELLLDQN
jgi:3,4-dihydroxy 2-butanone 4-phosphate synthase/GTP cyclohydrolase II